MKADLMGPSNPGTATKVSFAVILFSILCCGTLVSTAQHNVFSVGSTKALTIKTGTLFSADSLVMIPATDLTLNSNAVLVTPVPTPGLPIGSIDRVYYLNTPIIYTGSMMIYYKLSELNGNSEPNLKYTDSTIGAWWQISGSSIVNTSTHYVQQTLSSRSIIAVTASQLGNVLAVRLISFTGAWAADRVALQWVIDANEKSGSFAVERSQDGEHWGEAGLVPGSQIIGRYRYSFDDYDASFTTRFYRIKLIGAGPDITYSNIVKINKGQTANRVFVAAKSHGAIIHFIGALPANVRVMNAAGQVIWKNSTTNDRYELNNLLPGIYFAQYDINGQSGNTKFAVR